MRRVFVQFNRSESFVHTRSSAGFTIITSGFEFSVHTGTITVASEVGDFTEFTVRLPRRRHAALRKVG